MPACIYSNSSPSFVAQSCLRQIVTLRVAGWTAVHWSLLVATDDTNLPLTNYTNAACSDWRATVTETSLDSDNDYNNHAIPP